LKLTDTHCHLDLEAFDKDRMVVIQQALNSGVERILIPALNGESSIKVTSLSTSHANLFAAIGFHPTEAGKWEKNSANQLKEIWLDSLIRRDEPFQQIPGEFEIKVFDPADQVGNNQSERYSSRKIVAVGEIGLDYYWESAAHDIQHSVLRQQLDLAQDLNLPVILHSREKNDALEGNCMDDLLGFLEIWMKDRAQAQPNSVDTPGVLHSFSGSMEAARRAIEMNFMIGVTGSVTYRKSNRRQEIIAALPLERLLIETDAPFQSPTPQRGKRNEPAFVRYIADKIAEIKMTTPERVADITTANAARIFGWGGAS
jgi:TatD DNase family protein